MHQLDGKGGEDLSQLAQSVCAMIENLPVPTIGCVDGFALGGGCELAMSCDFICATRTSQFAQPEVKIGLIPGFGGHIRLNRLVGTARAKELIFSGRQISAQEAHKIGLVLEVFDTRQELLEAARSNLQIIAQNSPQAVAVAKQTMSEIQGRSAEEAFSIERRAYGSLFDHPEKKEGIQAFLDKRLRKF